MEVLKAFGLVALGMLINQFYNYLGWKKFYEGRKDGRGEHERKDAMEKGQKERFSMQKRLPR